MDAAQIIARIRECSETAESLSKTHEDADQRTGWYGRWRQCQEILESIPGTPEHTAMLEKANRLGIDI